MSFALYDPVHTFVCSSVAVPKEVPTNHAFVPVLKKSAVSSKSTVHSCASAFSPSANWYAEVTRENNKKKEERTRVIHEHEHVGMTKAGWKNKMANYDRSSV